VRASFAIPLVFDPVQLDGHTLVDGGLAENVPVRLARELGAGRVLLSGLPVADMSGVPRTPAMAQRLVDLLFDQTYPPLGAADVDIESEVADAGNLDFRDTTVRTMVTRGKAAARRAFGALPPEAMRCLTSASAARRAARAALAMPALAQPLLAREATGEARHFVEKTLGARAGGTLGFDTLQARLARLGEVEAIRAAWLHPVGATADSVALSPVLQLAPRRAVGAGLAYDGDLGGRAWAGIVDRRVAGRPLEIALRGAAGEWRQDAYVELRKGVEDVRDARAPFVLAGVSREDVRMFTSRGVERPRTELPRVRERVAMAGVDLPRGDRLELQTAIFIRQWDDARESAVLPAADVRREATASGLALRVRAGDGTRRLVRVEGEWTPRYGRALVVARRTLGTGHWQAGGSVRLGAVGRDAPLTAWLPLGGSEGFAGLRIGERLGRAEASAAVDVSRAVMGPVRLQLTLMGGQVAGDPSRPLDGEWLAGARMGVGADTPIGPVRAQYGMNGERRSQWYLRVGHWF
jgi:NTE family protein